MAEQVVKGFQKPNTGGSPYNTLQFIIEQAIRRNVITCIVCKVVKTSGAYVDVLPLVTQIDGFGNAVEPTTLFHLPYMRYHAGVAAVILDPVPGDIGLAVFAQKDCSNVKTGTTAPQPPASFRENSMANGFYIGGFLNQSPSTFIELKQSGEIIITAPAGLTINGDVDIKGRQIISGECIADGISVSGHIHNGDSGGQTSAPIR